MSNAGTILHPFVSALLLTVPFTLSSSANAQARSPYSGLASVTMLQAAEARQVRALDFGRVVPSDEPSVITVAPDGSVSCSSARVCDQGATAAAFRVTGSEQAVSVAVDSVVVLSTKAGSTIRFVPSLSSQILTFADGEAMISVGGALAVGAGQAPGAYAGKFQITFQYQ